MEPTATASDSLPVPVFAKPSRTKLSEDRLSIELNPCPERDALLKGKGFAIAATNFAGMFEGVAAQGVFRLRPQGSGYSLDEDDLLTSELSAWSMPKSASKQAKITANPITIGSGPNSIQIMADGKARCSADLYGQSIRLRVAYPQAIVMSSEPVGTLRAHLVVRDAGGAIAYLGLPGCQVEAIGNSLSLSFTPATAIRKVLVA